jgi:hypothetical protein
MARTSSRILRRPAIASALYRPCLKVFRLPLGAPVDRPPCIRHRPFGIAACWHGSPVVRQWGLNITPAKARPIAGDLAFQRLRKRFIMAAQRNMNATRRNFSNDRNWVSREH